MFITYSNYKGGINNMVTIFDNNGNFVRSTQGKDVAIKNFIKKYGTQGE